MIVLGPFRLLFRLLQISPSYELARRFKAGERSKAFLRECPIDFEAVLKVHEKFGDVMEIDEESWLRIGPGKHFDWQLTGGPLTHLGFISGERDSELLKLARKALGIHAQHLHARGYEGQAAVLVARLDAPDHILVRDFKRAINIPRRKVRDSWAKAIGEDGAVFHKKRIHIEKLSMGVNLMLERVANPTLPYWRSALKVGFSDTFDKRVTNQRLEESERQQARRDYEKIAYRAVKKFERMAEHAARGRFPCDDPMNYSKFDYDGIARRLNAYHYWMTANPDKGHFFKNIMSPELKRKYFPDEAHVAKRREAKFNMRDPQQLLFEVESYSH